MIFLESLEGENHVFHADRLAVVPFGFGAQAVDHVSMVSGMIDGFGEQPVFGGHLVHRRHHQGVEQLIQAGHDRALHAGHHHIEIVEGTERDHAHGAALRGVDVDVLEILEAWGILQLAEQREAVLPGALLSLRHGPRPDPFKSIQHGRSQRGGAGVQDGSAGNAHSRLRQTDDDVRPRSSTDYVGFWIDRHRNAIHAISILDGRIAIAAPSA